MEKMNELKGGELVRINISDPCFLPNWLQHKIGLVIKKTKYDDVPETYQVLIHGEKFIVGIENLLIIK